MADAKKGGSSAIGGWVATAFVTIVVVFFVIMAFDWLFGWGPWNPARQQAQQHQTFVPSPQNGQNWAERTRKPKKERFLLGCAEHGAPVTDIGRGVKNCHADSHVETYIDGERVE